MVVATASLSFGSDEMISILTPVFVVVSDDELSIEVVTGSDTGFVEVSVLLAPGSGDSTVEVVETGSEIESSL